MDDEQGDETVKVALKNLVVFPYASDFAPEEARVRNAQESMRRNGAWALPTGRRGPNGTVEIPCGRARLEAMRRTFGKDHEVEVQIQDYSDEEMLQAMKDENDEEYDVSFPQWLNLVGTTVVRYYEGAVELDEPPANTPKSRVRWAPGFVQGRQLPGTSPNAPYTASTLAAHLGEDITKISDILRGWEVIELGWFEIEDFDGLKHDQARQVLTAARKAYREGRDPHVWTQLEEDGSEVALEELKTRRAKAIARASQAGRRVAAGFRAPGANGSKPPKNRRTNGTSTPKKKRQMDQERAVRSGLVDAVGVFIAVVQKTKDDADKLTPRSRAFLLRLVRWVREALDELEEVLS